jgi:hypothetical protein
MKPYDDVRHSYAGDDHDKRDQLDGERWFEGSSFSKVTTASVSKSRHVTVPALVGRALSRSYTSPAMLGDSRAEFEAELTAALEPFVQDGVLQEQITARATIFARQTN